jgi:hypothetical protein
MMRRGEPLGAVAAALASPETAERNADIPPPVAASSTALRSARLTVGRSGGNMGMLDGLHAQQMMQSAEVATSGAPFGVNGHTSQNGSNGSQSTS